MSKATSHAQKAVELFSGGCNCSQASFCAFCDVTGMDETLALRLSSSFGGGMGRMREVCGALSGVFMACGILYGYSDVGNDTLKAEHYALVQEIARKFKERHGSIICRELLAHLSPDSSPNPTARTEEFYKTRPCAKFIHDAAEILDEVIAGRGLPLSEQKKTSK